MTENSSRPVAAASAACFRQGKLLLARRAHPPMLWTLPGGRIETGERAETAALRELLEETGVEAEIAGFAGYRETILPGGGGHFIILAFAARWRKGGIALSPELSDARWIDPGAIGTFETTAGLAEIVEAARRLAEK